MRLWRSSAWTGVCVTMILFLTAALKRYLSMQSAAQEGDLSKLMQDADAALLKLRSLVPLVIEI